MVGCGGFLLIGAHSLEANLRSLPLVVGLLQLAVWPLARWQVQEAARYDREACP